MVALGAQHVSGVQAASMRRPAQGCIASCMCVPSKRSLTCSAGCPLAGPEKSCWTTRSALQGAVYQQARHAPLGYESYVWGRDRFHAVLL